MPPPVTPLAEHPVTTLDRIRGRLQADASKLADPVDTWQAIQTDLEAVRTVLAALPSPDPLIRGLVDTVQALMLTAGGMLRQIIEMRGPSSHDAVPPTPKPAELARSDGPSVPRGASSGEEDPGTVEGAT